MSTSDRDSKLAHDLIAEHFDRDNMGRLREAIAQALTTARREQAERDAREAESWVCAGATITTETARGIAAAIRAGAKEGKQQ